MSKSVVAFGQVNISAKPTEKPEFAYLLATSDLDINSTALNNQNSYTVLATNELVKLGLVLGIISSKLCPLTVRRTDLRLQKLLTNPETLRIEWISLRVGVCNTCYLLWRQAKPKRHVIISKIILRL